MLADELRSSQIVPDRHVHVLCAAIVCENKNKNKNKSENENEKKKKEEEAEKQKKRKRHPVTNE